MNVERTITVKWTQQGFHRWPEAQGVREYLSSRHRHLFYCEVSVTVEHGDREIEFHDLLDLCKTIIPETELNRQSCEDLTDRLLESVSNVYPDRPRYSATVWEDDEVGATTVLSKH